LICGFLGQRPIAEYFARKALQQAEVLDDLSSRAWVFQLTGLYSLGQAQWEQAEYGLFQSTELYRRQKDLRHCNESMGLLAQVRFYQGQIERALELSQQSSQLARQRGDKELESRSLETQARVHLLQDRIQLALSLAKQSRALAESLGGRLRVQSQAILLRLALKAGDLQQAHRLAQELVDLKDNSQEAISATDLEVFTAEMEYLLHCEGAGEMACLPQSVLELREAFQEFAHRFPMAGPRFELYQGKIAQFQEQLSSARSHWKKSIKLAKRLGMLAEIQAAEALL